MRRVSMPAFGRNAVFPALVVATMASFAGAQQKQCEIDENTPNQVARAVLELTLAQGAAKPEDAAPRLKSAIKLLSEADKGRNPVGRNNVFGRTLVIWAMQPNIGSTPKRSTLGFTTDPDATIDLVAAIDSSFTIVEKANPECMQTLAILRQQKLWVDL